MVRHAFSIVLVAVLVVTGTQARHAFAASSRSQRAAGNTQFLLFNLAPAGTYQIKRNGSTTGNQAAGPEGSLAYTTVTSTGDEFLFTLTGVDPVTPAAPAAFTAAGTTGGCVNLSWNTPPASDYVTDYSLLWGTAAGVYSDSLAIDRQQVARSGNRSSVQRCAMPSGTFHFALRAHNSFNRWSGLSNPSSTTISNENTAGPVAPGNVKVTEPSFGCAHVTWNKVSDPAVTGYRVYFGTRPRSQAAYSDSVEAGNASFADRCALAAGTYYFAVRAYTATGVFSVYSSEKTLVARGVDVASPALSQLAPASGATGVALNARVYFVVTDDKTGVNTSAIQVRVNGTSCPFTTSTASGGYAVQCTPSSPLPASSTILVEVQVADRASPANTATRSWSFNTGLAPSNDTVPPTIALVTPSSGASGVDARPTIEVAITDSGLGVDLSSIEMMVEGSPVTFNVEGTPASARVRYQPASGFAPGTVVHVSVSACDAATSPNCAGPAEFSFTVVEAVASSATAAIIPDGYWADDPARPLEVRNLPRDWRVRIFDASGVRVRQFESSADGTTFSWDFRNDGGQRVAPALYLVRVTNPAGTVFRAGRFIVQSAQ